MAEKVSGEKPAKKPGLFSRIGRFFKDLRGESKKVVWPTKQQTINNTGVVIACIVVVGAFIGVLDAIFTYGLQTLLKLL